MSRRVLFPREELAPLLASRQGEGQRVVLANGCFDLLHAGHVDYLEAARAEGDVLVVALNTDASVRRLKGDGRPRLPLEQRARLIAAFRVVDFVIAFPEPTLHDTLRLLRPDVHAKGADYAPESLPEADLDRQLGIRIAIVGDPKDHGTRDIIKQIRELEL